MFSFWFVELAEQFQVHNLYKSCKSTKIQWSNFGFIEKKYGSVLRIIFAVIRYFLSKFSREKVPILTHDLPTALIEKNYYLLCS